MTIALDAMGGDLAPDEIVKGALLAAGRLDSRVALVGQPAKIEPLLESAPATDKLFVYPASEVVEMEDSTRVALRGKKDSSVARTVDMVREGEADACVSAGNSGGYMALCHTRLRTIPGIIRPAIALFLPSLKDHPRVLLDAGANADCKPVHMQQFGIMGSIYARLMLGLEDPKVGILSIGSEDHKGNELTQASMELLDQAPINFIGNVEGDGIFGYADVDVVVCDGFVGNVVLKVAEGAAMALMDKLKEGVQASVKAKAGALLMKDVFRGMRASFDYGTYGGALLLGVNGVCVVGHGKSDATAICNALLVAERLVKARLIEHVSAVCPEVLV